MDIQAYPGCIKHPHARGPAYTDTKKILKQLRAADDKVPGLRVHVGGDVLYRGVEYPLDRLAGIERRVRRYDYVTEPQEYVVGKERFKRPPLRDRPYELGLLAYGRLLGEHVEAYCGDLAGGDGLQ